MRLSINGMEKHLQCSCLQPLHRQSPIICAQSSPVVRQLATQAHANPRLVVGTYSVPLHLHLLSFDEQSAQEISSQMYVDLMQGCQSYLDTGKERVL